MPESVVLTLPAMGESVSEGTVTRWLKAVGDPVSEGESLVEVTTDKVDVEVPSPTDGVLAEISAAEGDTIPVGGALAHITPGKAAAAPKKAAPAPVEATSEAAPAPVPTKPTAPSATAPAPASTLVPQASTALASPLARRAAAIKGVSLGTVNGSGPGGAIRKSDVSSNGNGSHGPAPTVVSAAPEAGTVPMTGPAAALVDYMERSRDIPTATSFRTFNVDALDARRRELNAALAAAGQKLKISFTHIIGYALARAAGEMPVMATSFARDEKNKPVRVTAGIHLGLAVDSHRKDGTRFLVVPVIRDASYRSFSEFHQEYERLIDRARNNALTADELQGATMSLTNPGGIGTVASVPRLMPGQGTIVATGAIGYPAEWKTASPEKISQAGVAKVMTITSTYDHRVIQGAESGEYLARMEALLSGADGFYEDIFASLGVAAPSAMAQPATPAPTAKSSAVTSSSGGLNHAEMAAVQAATSVIKAHRTHGHLGANLDPLGSVPIGDPAMDPYTVGLNDQLMEMIPADILRVYVSGRNMAEVIPNLHDTYCGTIAYEIEHISSHDQRVWLREHIESGAFRLPMTAAEKLELLSRLTKVEAMEQFLRRTYLGQKTFSIEGVDAMVPMLETLLTMVADDGIQDVVIGMAHRGRNATIAHVVNRPYETILTAFERAEMRTPVGISEDDPTGDVKYHLGAEGTYTTDSKKEVAVRLLPNPSHLEAVNGVVEGWVRADQTQRHSPQIYVDPKKAMPVLIHGDAAFSGEGVVPEVMNLQSLSGYSTGGTVHIISNNQIGFTTEPTDARSTRYASDLAKGFDVPIVHVNADDVEACIHAVRFAYDYRRTYHRDVVIDLIGYRRFGHNETDEPSYTQPVMYEKIKHHPSVRQLFVTKLAAEGVITEDDAATMMAEATEKLSKAHKVIKEQLQGVDDLRHPEIIKGNGDHGPEEITQVPGDVLRALDQELVSTPKGFTVNPKLARQLERRQKSLDEGGIDWGTAESLAFAKLLCEGHPIRLTGQDTERGTFSHRHLVFHDAKSGDTWTPMQHLSEAKATFELHNSPLSEVGALSFEYGYSASAPETMVLWEAQFGDFVNNAQMVIDQFISSAAAKWDQHSRLVLLLPHGYEGMGPEHSSARLERFMTLAAHGNMRIANCSTAAQYFHLIRDQAMSNAARPLILLTPKSLLRAKSSSCTLDELTNGKFHSVIDDPDAGKRAKSITTLLFCTGKIYHDLDVSPMRADATDLAIARVELLNPLPLAEMLRIVARYPNLKQMYWVQEEPSNMGAWPTLARPVGLERPDKVHWDYVGRPRRASPSEGFAGSHMMEQEQIVSSALLTSPALQKKTGRKPEVAGER